MPQPRMTENDSNNMFVRLTVHNIPITALIDTGSSPNLVDRAFYERLLKQRREHPVKVREDARHLVTADSKPLHVTTSVDVTLRIGGLSVPCSLVVIDNLCHPILLGLEFLRDTQADIHLTSSTLSLYHGLVYVPLTKGDFQPTVHTVANISIPANSHARFTVKTRAKLAPGLYEIEQHYNRQHLMIARSVGRPQNGRMICCAVNPTDRPIRINKRSPIATISPVSVMQPTELPPPPLEGALPPISEMKRILQEEKKLSFKDTALKGLEFDNLVELLFRNRDLFATSLADLTTANVPPIKIDIQGATPHRARPIRYTPEQKREIDRQVQEMLQANVIEPSDSPWQSNIILVRKGQPRVQGRRGQPQGHTQGQWRLAIDFRFVNSLCKMEAFPLPLFNDLCDRILDQSTRPETNLGPDPQRNPLFVTLDLKSGFWQLGIDESSRNYLTFHTDTDSFRFKVLPFGLSQAPSEFQRVMNRVLRHLPFAPAFLDDILVVAHNADDLNIKLQRVFDRLRGANLKVHSEKCVWAATKTKYLGHVIEDGKLSINQDKLSIIQNYPTPKTQKQLKSWLRLCNYFRKFIKGHAEQTFALRQLLKKDQPYIWTAECQVAFDKTKYALLHAPVLLLPDYNKKSVVLTDSSVRGLGYCLAQYDDQGRLHPCIYSGRALRPAETRYNISQLEMLATVEAVKEFHHYLAQNHFEIWTDHIANTFYRSMKMTDNNRMTRWLLFLSPYSFDFCYKRGAGHVVAIAYLADHGRNTKLNQRRRNILQTPSNRHPVH